MLARILSFTPAIVSSILAIFLLCNLRKNRTNRFLAYSFLCLALWNVLIQTYAYPEIPLGWALDCLCMMVTFLMPGFFYLYVRDLTSIEGIRKRDWIMMVPATVLTAADVICYIIMAAMGMQGSDYLCYLAEHGTILPDAPLIFKIKRFIGSDLYRMGTLFMIFGVVSYSFVACKRYLKTLGEYFTSISETTAMHQKTLSWCLLAAMTSALIFTTRTYSTDITYMGWAAAGALILSASMIALFFFAVNRSYSINVLREMLAKEDARETETVEDDGPYEMIKTRMNKALEEKFYLDPEISLVSLTSEIGSNRTYVSSFINREYGCSFSDFVNSRRVEYAKQLLESCTEKNHDYDDLMREAGFNSRQSFIRNFNKFAGTTPAEYYKLKHQTR